MEGASPAPNQRPPGDPMCWKCRDEQGGFDPLAETCQLPRWVVQHFNADEIGAIQLHFFGASWTEDARLIPVIQEKRGPIGIDAGALIVTLET